MIRRALFLGSLLAGLAGPASAALSSTDIGTIGGTTSQSATVLTTSGACAAGATAVLAVGWVNVNTTATISDSAGGNTWTGTKVGASLTYGYIYSSVLTNGIANGGSVTATWGSNVTIKSLSLVCVTGASTTDQNLSGATGSSTAPTETTGTLGQAAEIVFGMVVVNNGYADTFTEDTTNGTYTSDAVATSSSGIKTHLAHQIVSVTTAKTYAPTLGTSRTWTETIKTFKDAGSAPSYLPNNLTMMGAGK